MSAATTPLAMVPAAPEAHTSERCPLCGCTVMVWKRRGVPVKILRALALASHVRTLHPTLAAR